MSEIVEPTGEQCNSNALMWEDVYHRAYAIWYPLMRGYVGKAVVVVNKEFGENADCFEAYVWHDGDFPFHNGECPACIHHCSSEQFIEFGTTVRKLELKNDTAK